MTRLAPSIPWLLLGAAVLPFTLAGSHERAVLLDPAGTVVCS